MDLLTAGVNPKAPVPREIQHDHAQRKPQGLEMMTDPPNYKVMELSTPSPPVPTQREQLILFLVKSVPETRIFIRNLYLSIQTRTFKNHESQSSSKSWDSINISWDFERRCQKLRTTVYCVTHYFKIFTQTDTTKFLSTVKRARSSPREKKNHHIFIRFLEAGHLKIVQVLQFITC